MASASSSTPFLGIRQQNQTQQHQSSTAASSSTTTTTSTTTTPTTMPQKKRRNQPGTPCKYLYAFFITFHYYLKNHFHVHFKYPFCLILFLDFLFPLLTNNHVKETLNPAITYRTRSFFNSVKADCNGKDFQFLLCLSLH
ncbi:hypothetical protein V8G54_013634 [Vigna mungo]|uniref:Uncharacterized protein n=1 Tax=Vigna mungo TaxID=3915 RepID=A0AAQ3NF87_VIGMU